MSRSLAGSSGMSQNLAKATATAMRSQGTQKLQMIEPVNNDDSANVSVVEGTVPKLPQTLPTFRSMAHQRGDEFWNEILGKQDAGPYNWLERVWFKAIAATAIVANSLLLNMDSPAQGWLWRAEHVIMAFSYLELAILIRRVRAGVPLPNQETKVYVMLEVIGLLSSTIDVWLMPLLHAMLPGHLPGEDCLHLLRMMWLLRLVRLIRVVPKLREMFHGLMDAFQSFCWVLVLMMLLLYAVAILCTRLIGHAEGSFDVTSDDGSGDGVHSAQQIRGHTNPDRGAEEILAMFSNVQSSTFNLFNIMTAWSLLPFIPMFDTVPWFASFSIVFYVFSGWILLAVMAGTVTFNMISAKSRASDPGQAENQQDLRTVLTELFEILDANGDGQMSKEEFQVVMRSKELMDCVCDGNHLKVQDLETLFEWLDQDKSGYVDMNEFLDGITWLSQPLQSKSMFMIREKVSKSMKQKAKKMETFISSEFEKHLSQVKAPIRKTHAAFEQAHVLNASVKQLFAALEASRGSDGEPPCSLDEIEARLTEQIDDISRRIARFVPARKSEGH